MPSKKATRKKIAPRKPAARKRPATGRKKTPSRDDILAAIAGSVAAPIWCIDSETNIIFANAVISQTVGYSIDELLSMTVPDIDRHFPWEQLDAYKERIRQDGMISFDTVLTHKDGREFPIRASVARLLVGCDEFFTMTIRDVTDAKAQERSLRESEERYRTLVNAGPDAVVILQGGSYAFINSAFTKMFGYDADDLAAGLQFMQLVQEEDIPAVRQRYEDRIAGKKLSRTFRINLVAKDGSIVPCETSAVLITHDGRPADLVVMRDTSEREHVISALRESEHRYRDLYEELAEQKVALEQKNLALKEVLTQIERDRLEFRKQLSKQIKTVITPSIRRLKKQASDKTSSIVDVIERGLDELSSEHGQNPGSNLDDLTPRQREICHLIERGKANKAIAKSLDISTRTVEVHRDTIRKKLGLSGKKVNLTVFLRMLNRSSRI